MNAVLGVGDLLPIVATERRTQSPAEDLTERAYEDLKTTLQRFGNKLDPSTPGGKRHCEALRSVLSTYSRLAYGEPGRIAYPLAVGVGKTQSVASWCAATYHLGTDHSILVCQEKVSSLEELYGNLLKKGVPASEIGIWHSKPVDPRRTKESEDYATIPSCEMGEVDQFRFLLVTHAKIKTRRDRDRLNTFSGTERSLVVWDESLLRNEGRSVQASMIEHAYNVGLGSIRGKFAKDDAKHDEAALEALDYTEHALNVVHKTMTERSDSSQPVPVPSLPERDASTIEDYRAAIKRIVKGHASLRALSGMLCHFLDFCQEPLRLVNLGDGGTGDGVITYLPSVPDFERIVVLDASYLIRDLCQLDSSLKLVDDYEHVKRFDSVTVEQARENGGRNTVQRLRRNSKLTKRIVEDVLNVPSDEGVLIVTYKTRGKRGPIEVLQDALEEAGVALNEKILVPSWRGRTKTFEPRRRIEFVHWGQHKAISKYAYCKHMVAVGVMRRDSLEIASNIVAQTEDYDTPLASDREFLQKVIASEQFYCLQQFIGRGQCREIVNGYAKPCRVKVYDQADFSPFLEDGLPGVVWSTQQPQCRARRRPRSKPKAEHIAGQIVRFLRDYDGDRISVRALKRELGAEKVHRNSFNRALDLALCDLPEWAKEGRSLVRRT